MSNANRKSDLKKLQDSLNRLCERLEHCSVEDLVLDCDSDSVSEVKIKTDKLKYN